jgi:hypothetical protein
MDLNKVFKRIFVGEIQPLLHSHPTPITTAGYIADQALEIIDFLALDNFSEAAKEEIKAIETLHPKLDKIIELLESRIPNKSWLDDYSPLTKWAKEYNKTHAKEEVQELWRIYEPAWR